MRPWLVRAAALLTLVSGFVLLAALSTGPVASRTGAFAVAGKPAEPDCSACHSGNPVNGPNGMLEILDVPAAYTPGATYPMRVRLSHAWSPQPGTLVRWGFQIQAVLAATGDSAGIWVRSGVPPDSLRIRRGSGVYVNRVYLEHTIADIREGKTPPIDWGFAWTAPANDTGRVYFFAAGTAGNGDGAPADDFVYTAVQTSVGATSVDVSPRPAGRRASLSGPFPNPMTTRADLAYSLPGSGFVDLSVHDAQGRRVASLVRGHREVGSHRVTWDGVRDGGGRAPAGIYFARLAAPGEPRALTRTIALAD